MTESRRFAAYLVLAFVLVVSACAGGEEESGTGSSDVMDGATIELGDFGGNLEDAAVANNPGQATQ